MANRQAKTSLRFTRAARAERDRLDRQRARLSKRREDAQAKVDSLDEELEAVDQQLRVLEGLAASPEMTIEIREGDSDEPSGLEPLRGSRIREVAVPLLLREHGISPIHYKDWFSLLERAGYAVAGKRPDAVFLNQVSRSPLVWTSTQSGSYYLDPSIIEKLREQLVEQQRELSELLANVPVEGDALAEGRERQQEIGGTIRRIERELDEAVRAMEAAGETTESARTEPRQIRVVSSTQTRAA